jgi:hypothetical protein
VIELLPRKTQTYPKKEKKKNTYLNRVVINSHKIRRYQKRKKIERTISRNLRD